MRASASSAPARAALRRLAATLLLGVASLPAPASRAEPPAAWQRRGEQVEARYEALTARLEAAHARLLAALEPEDPVLFRRLRDEAPERAESGYQLVPEVVPDEPTTPEDLRPSHSSYSWPLTLDKIDAEIERVAERLERPLDALAAPQDGAAHVAWETLVTAYEELADARENLERHLRHNRLWQPIIHRERARYDRATEIYDAVLRRDAIQRALGATTDTDFRAALADLPELDATAPRSALEPELAQQERALRERIQAASEPPDARPFLVLEESEPRRWTLRVAVYTDLEDEALLRAFQQAVESHWRVQDGDAEYRLALTIRRIASDELYRRAPDCTAAAPCTGPKRGDAVDFERHLSLFPADGAVLTTGAETIHVKGSRSILLGPLDVSPRTLAHEFGHVLGFRDEYVRGYRDLGADGYEILEVVPTPEDIMASPGHGSVQRFHFEALRAACASVPARSVAHGSGSE